MKKEDFIAQATAVHGDKFCYSLLEDEFKYGTKVPILCEKHGEFTQTAGNHITNKRGCPQCGFEHVAAIKKQRSKEKFFRESPIIHDNKYDYSKVDFVKVNTKVTIICPIHGEFEQEPEVHLRGNGCRKCGRDTSGDKQRLRKEDFIRKAKEVHGDKFDYSKVDYTTSIVKVTITCKEHGDFEQQPNNHVSGKNGCPQCIPEKLRQMFMMPKDVFMERVTELHPTLDFSESNYTGAHNKIEFVCPEHGKMSQKPRHLLLNHGCRLCGIGRNTIARSKDETHYIEKFNELFDGKYDYSATKFSNSKDKFTVICPDHGEFQTTVSNHIRSKGCPKCAKYKSGFKSDREGSFYILKVTDTVCKFGISNYPEDRIRSIQNRSCFDIELMYLFTFDDGYIARLIETTIIESDIQKGVVNRCDMRSGFSETFYLKDLSRVLSIVDDFTNNLSG